MTISFQSTHEESPEKENNGPFLQDVGGESGEAAMEGATRKKATTST